MLQSVLLCPRRQVYTKSQNTWEKDAKNIENAMRLSRNREPFRRSYRAPARVYRHRRTPRCQLLATLLGLSGPRDWGLPQQRSAGGVLLSDSFRIMRDSKLLERIKSVAESEKNYVWDQRVDHNTLKPNFDQKPITALICPYSIP